MKHFRLSDRIHSERGVRAMVSSSYSSEEFLKIYNRHVDTVYRICFSFMKNSSDTEDMVQETFLKLLSNGKRFESESHEKAWLIVTARNECRGQLKHWSRTRREDGAVLDSLIWEQPEYGLQRLQGRAEALVAEKRGHSGLRSAGTRRTL